jgi:ABC-type antimicrobial peptide transport system permease subunit
MDTRPEAAAPLLQTAVSGVNPDLPVSRFTTMPDALASTVGQERILAGLTTAFAVVALLLAAVGLYTVLAHVVAARTTEIGIRVAIGARRGTIFRLVVGDAMRLVLIGVAIGLAGALAASHLLAAQLHDVSARDPLAYALVAVLFCGVGVAASAVPALRASRVDPLAALAAAS